MKPLHSIVEQQIDNYISEKITITDAYQFSQYETIQQIENFMHSKFTSGQNDSRGNPKPFFNITKGKVNIGAGRIEGPNNWRFRGQDNAPYVQEHSDLYASIRAGSPQNEGENGAKSTMTAIMGRMAGWSGKLMLWDEAIESKIPFGKEFKTLDEQPPILPDADGIYQLPVTGKYQAI